MAKKNPEQKTDKESIKDVNKLVERFLANVNKDISSLDRTAALQAQDACRLDEASNPAQGLTGAEAQESLEPLVDVFEKGLVTTVIAEMHGISKDKIRIIAQEDEVYIEAITKGAIYSKRAHFKFPVEPTPKSAKFNNGILELVFMKTEAGGKPQIISLKD